MAGLPSITAEGSSISSHPAHSAKELSHLLADTMQTCDRLTRKKRAQSGRVRVTRACDWCKRKKLRCSGTQPCSVCQQLRQDCTYNADYSRGRNPAISVISTVQSSVRGADSHSNEERNDQEEISSLPHKQPLLPVLEPKSLAVNDIRPAHARPTQRSQFRRTKDTIDITSSGEVQLNSDFRETGQSSCNSPEVIGVDEEGQYVGPASPVSFLSRALKKLHDNNCFISDTHDSFIFNFADAPLPPFDPHFLTMPSRAEAKTLIHRYFDFACPTHRFLHPPTVEMWCDKLYDNIRSPAALEPGDRETRAIVLMVLAQASTYAPCGDSLSNDAVNSAAYFAASEHHLSSETGGIRLTSIQARLIQCFYLLTQSRVNSVWIVFGNLANLALAIGLHRRKPREDGPRANVVEHEYRKRVFWSAYILDSYLGVGLGRPRSFHDEDVDQDLPLCVDDAQVTPTQILPSQQSGQSVTLASICHAKLSKIISSILRNLYGIKRLSLAKQVKVAQQYDDLLREWRQEIHGFLDIANVEVMMTIYRRQHTVLQLAHSHAVILLHRQALLRRLSANITNAEDSLQSALQHSVQRCLEAATTIVNKLRELVEKQQMYSAFWFTHYYVFSALVALYVYVVQSRSKPANTWRPYLELAQQGLRDLSACSTQTSYAQRYVVVLTELQNEALRPLDTEGHSAVLAQEGQSLYMQPIEIGHTFPVDQDSRAIAPMSEPYTDTPGQVRFDLNEFNDLGHRNSGLSLQNDAFNGEVLDLHNMDNREAFGNLAVEGLADLEFLFSIEDMNTMP